MPVRKSKSLRRQNPQERFDWADWLPPDRSKFVNPWDNHALLDYYLALLRAYGYIRLLGLPQLKDNPDIPIESLFVEPEFSQQLIPPDQQIDQWPPRISVTEAFLTYPRIVVLGDPGIGKTSLMQWVIAQFCRSGASALQASLGPLVPMPFVLRELALTPDLDWDKLLGLFLSQPAPEKLRADPRLCEQLLATGQAMILLDGLDEVSAEETRKALRSAVVQGILRYNTCRWIMTSRVVGYDRTPFHFASHNLTPFRLPTMADARLDWADAPYSPADAKLLQVLGGKSLNLNTMVSNITSARSELLYLAPFNDSQIERLVRNWYAEREADPNKRNESIKDLLRGIREHSGTEKLARIPNLLTMMALIHRVRARLPQGRVNLYSDIADAYLQTIDEFRGIHEVGYTLAQKKHWLARVAFEMQRRRREEPRLGGGENEAPGILADRAEVLAWLADIIEVVEPTERELAATTFLDYLQRRTGLFLERSPGRFSFLHLSFQEYFAACYLAEEVTGPDWLDKGYDRQGSRPTDLESYARAPLWKETLVFLFELLGQQRPRWVDTVARKAFANTLGKPTLDEFAREDEGDVLPDEQDPDVVLLAELSVDPYSGFSQSLRETSWTTVWRCAFSRRYWDANPCADALLAGASHFADAVWRSLTRPAEELHERTLNLTRCQHLTNASPISRIVSLEDVDLIGSPVQQGIAELGHMPNLHHLHLTWPGHLRDPGELAKLRNLDFLSIESSQEELDIGQIPLLPRVQSLFLSDYRKLAGLEHLRDWSQLQTICCWPAFPRDKKGGDDFGVLRYLPSVRSVFLGNSDAFVRLDELPLVSPIEDLYIWGFNALRELRLSPCLNRLKWLRLTHCDAVSDLSPLAELTELKYLELRSCPGVKSLAPLSACPNLEQIVIKDCPALEDIPQSLEAILVRK